MSEPAVRRLVSNCREVQVGQIKVSMNTLSEPTDYK